MKIISVVGARPNFMKIAPFIRAVEAYNKTNTAGIEHQLVHTGQHYDDKMSRAFFMALDIPDADINLDVGSGLGPVFVFEMGKIYCGTWETLFNRHNAVCSFRRDLHWNPMYSSKY